MNDEQGAALPGAVVHLSVAPGDATARDAWTDENGLATFDGLASDQPYVLRVLFPGFVPVVGSAVASANPRSPRLVVRLSEAKACMVVLRCGRLIHLEDHRVATRFYSDFLADLPGHFARSRPELPECRPAIPPCSGP